MRTAMLLVGVLLAASCAGPRSPRSLEELYAESQREKGADVEAARLRELAARRARRLEEVQHHLERAAELTVQEQLWSAVLLLDSDDPADLERASELALAAAERGDDRGFPLAAEAIDRGLMVQGYPQRYGTQYVYTPVTGTWSLWVWDPATSDAERTAMGLPTLSEALARVELLNRRDP